MKRYLNTVLIVALLGFSACNDDFLTIQTTESQEAGGPATEGAIMANLTSAYQILLFDSYADNNYNSLFFVSDLRSDDVFKGGGDAGDQAMIYRLYQLDDSPTEVRVGPHTTVVLPGQRDLDFCENTVGMDKDNVAELKSEALF